MRGRRRTRYPRRLADLLDPFFKRRGLTKERVLYQIISRWPQIVGARIANRSEPSRLRGTELVVVVAGSTWHNEISLMQQLVLDRLQAAGFDEVKTLRLVLGPRSMAAQHERSRHLQPSDISTPRIEPPTPVLAPARSEQARRRATEDIPPVADSELVEAIRNARVAQLMSDGE